MQEKTVFLKYVFNKMRSDFNMIIGGGMIILLGAIFCQGGDDVSHTTLTKPSG